jgi:hypothetical protein
MDRGEGRVGALVRVLDHGIAGAVDEIGVVAHAAAHDVGAGSAVEQIVPAVTGQRIGECVAVALQVCIPSQHQIFHVRCKLEVDR